MKLDFPVLLCQRTSITQTLTPSSEYKIVLFSINVLVSFMFITLRASPITAATYATYLPGIANYDITLQDESNSLLGGLIRTGPSADFRNETVLISNEYFNNLMLVFGNNANIIYISWNRSPQTTLQTGSSKEFAAFSGFELFRFQTSSTLAPGSYTIDFFARTLEIIKIRNGGHITSSKS